jgi:hypothetical protein
MTARRFPPPWSVQELDACFIVIDNAVKERQLRERRRLRRLRLNLSFCVCSLIRFRFQPSIYQTTRIRFRFFARSEYFFLSPHLNSLRVNSHDPLPALNSCADCVSYSSVFHSRLRFARN